MRADIFSIALPLRHVTPRYDMLMLPSCCLCFRFRLRAAAIRLRYDTLSLFARFRSLLFAADYQFPTCTIIILFRFHGYAAAARAR